MLDLRVDSIYRLRAQPLSDLCGASIEEQGRLQDVVLGLGWRILELVLEGGERVQLNGIAFPGLRSR